MFKKFFPAISVSYSFKCVTYLNNKAIEIKFGFVIYSSSKFIEIK